MSFYKKVDKLFRKHEKLIARKNIMKSGNCRRSRREKTDRGPLRDPAEQAFGKFSAKSDVDVAPAGVLRREKFKTLSG